MNKQQLSQLVKSNPYFVATGRLKNWLQDTTTTTLPVSCTVFDMTDESLEQCIKFAVYGLTRGAGMTISLPQMKFSDWVMINHLSDHHITPYKSYEIITSKKRLKEVVKEFSQSGNKIQLLSVQDSLFFDNNEKGNYSIVGSWLRFLRNKYNYEKCYVDLTKLREPNTPSPSGVVASGAESFGEFYHYLYELQLDFSLTNFLKFLSKLNEIIKRGGKKFKKGAIVVYEDIENEGTIDEYLDLHLHQTPYIKKALYLPKKNHWDILPEPLKNKVVRHVDSGQIWLAKKQYDKNGKRLFSNVCLEALLPHRGTCMIGHVNLGLVKDDSELPKIFRSCMRILCEIHAHTGVGDDGYYLSPDEDKQVILGVVGLANFLANHDYFNYEELVNSMSVHYNTLKYESDVSFLYEAYESATKVAQEYNMDRAFGIAPTASCSFENYDLNGYVTTPNIAPPKAQKVDRISELEGGSFVVEYPSNVEIAKEVGFDTYYSLCNLWQDMMGSLAHSISMDLWMDKEITLDWVNKFLEDEVKTTYYRLAIDDDINDKSNITVQELPECDCAS